MITLVRCLFKKNIVWPGIIHGTEQNGTCTETILRNFLGNGIVQFLANPN